MGGRNKNTGVGDWGQFGSGDASKFHQAGQWNPDSGKYDGEWKDSDAEYTYENMTPEERQQWAALADEQGQPMQHRIDFVNGVRNRIKGVPGEPAPAAPATSGTDGDLYAKLLSGTDDARKKAQDAYYQQATSRLDPQWNQQEDATRTRLLNQGLDPSSEAGQNEMAQFGRDKNDAYDSAMRGSVLAGNSEAHNVLKDRLQSWMAENGDKLTREQIEKGDKADSMDSIMKLIPAFLAML